jgi:hypothetical protein
MNRYFRGFLYLICAVQAVFVAGYIFRLPFAVNIWPLRYTSDMSFTLVASVFAAAVLSTAWSAGTGDDGALAGISLDYAIIFLPMGVYAFQIAGRSEALLAFGVACLIGGAFGVGMFLWSARIPIRDPRPQPRLVRWSFAIFFIALILFGGMMVLKVPNVLPWRVTSESLVVYGWIFIGAAGYFAYGLLRPSWHNSAGQLLGFLGYDLVLVVPFLMRLPTVEPQFRLGLIFYTIVVLYSGGLAIYYLFVNPATRLWGVRQPFPDVTAS